MRTPPGRTYLIGLTTSEVDCLLEQVLKLFPITSALDWFGGMIFMPVAVTGLHRAATKEEVDIIAGPEIAANYRVVSHNARTGFPTAIGISFACGTTIRVGSAMSRPQVQLEIGIM